jgi:uncharacterized membrane protein YqgA involved in biofilm formation
VVQVELAPGRVLAELELGQVAVLELVIGLAVVPELETAPVAVLELVIGPVVAPEMETAPAVGPELVIGLAVVPELEAALVVALELVIGPAVGPELVIGQVEAELELVQVAVLLGTRSVTAAHRPGLVLHLLVAVAETTREPAAAEAVTAWEVAE